MRAKTIWPRLAAVALAAVYQCHRARSWADHGYHHGIEDLLDYRCYSGVLVVTGRLSPDNREGFEKDEKGREYVPSGNHLPLFLSKDLIFCEPVFQASFNDGRICCRTLGHSTQEYQEYRNAMTASLSSPSM